MAARWRVSDFTFSYEYPFPSRDKYVKKYELKKWSLKDGLVDNEGVTSDPDDNEDDPAETRAKRACKSSMK